MVEVIMPLKEQNTKKQLKVIYLIWDSIAPNANVNNVIFNDQKKNYERKRCREGMKPKVIKIY
jgi:hypothetical protein